MVEEGNKLTNKEMTDEDKPSDISVNISFQKGAEELNKQEIGNETLNAENILRAIASYYAIMEFLKEKNSIAFDIGTIVEKASGPFKCTQQQIYSFPEVSYYCLGQLGATILVDEVIKNKKLVLLQEYLKETKNEIEISFNTENDISKTIDSSTKKYSEREKKLISEITELKNANIKYVEQAKPHYAKIQSISNSAEGLVALSSVDITENLEELLKLENEIGIVKTWTELNIEKLYDFTEFIHGRVSYARKQITEAIKEEYDKQIKIGKPTIDKLIQESSKASKPVKKEKSESIRETLNKLELPHQLALLEHLYNSLNITLENTKKTPQIYKGQLDPSLMTLVVMSTGYSSLPSLSGSSLSKV